MHLGVIYRHTCVICDFQTFTHTSRCRLCLFSPLYHVFFLGFLPFCIVESSFNGLSFIDISVNKASALDSLKHESLMLYRSRVSYVALSKKAVLKVAYLHPDESSSNVLFILLGMSQMVFTVFSNHWGYDSRFWNFLEASIVIQW